jgi:ABC-2 type transport system permease protein
MDARPRPAVARGILLTLKVVFGDSITSITGQNALYRSVPLVALVATMSGATTGVVGINRRAP